MAPNFCKVTKNAANCQSKTALNALSALRDRFLLLPSIKKSLILQHVRQ